MQYIDNWYSRDDIAIIYSQLRGKELVYLFNDLENDIRNPKFLKYEFNKTINYLPLNSYSSFLIRNNNSINFLNNFINKIYLKDITTLYLPLISKLNLKNILPKKYIDIFSERLDSYYIDLSKTENELRNNISKRKRNNIEINKFNCEFNIASKEEEDYFCKLYERFMLSVGADKSQKMSLYLIKQILKLENNFLFCLKVDNEIQLMHLIGINKKKDKADFVFSASTDNGYSYGYLMLWKEILFLKNLGFKTFYLGGGIKKNDGVNNFKKRIGGEVLYNGGLKIIVNKTKYFKEINNYPNSKMVSNFFPIYLRDQIFTKTI